MFVSCWFHKNKSGCFYKAWPSHWLEMNKNFKTTIKRQTLNHFKYFSLFFFWFRFLCILFFFQFSFNIKCTSSYMHHETCCKICHNKHQSKWQTLVSWLHIQISPRLNKYPLILSDYSLTVHLSLRDSPTLLKATQLINRLDWLYTTGITILQILC